MTPSVIGQWLKATTRDRRGLTSMAGALSLVRMKRTNLVLDENLLEEAVRLSGERTYSRAVERALEDFVRRVRAGRILELAGSGLWEGDLCAVRTNSPGWSVNASSPCGVRFQ